MRKLLLLLVCALVVVSAKAEKVTCQQALQKAQLLMHGKQLKQSTMRRAPQKNADNAPYYVFNAEDNGGFVIVAGDDRMKDILGYSEHGSLDQDNLPDNVKWLLDYYAQIAANMAPSPSPRREAKAAASDERTELPALLTTTWDQGEGYNAQCPNIYGQNAPTGCVATAMAQVINYFQWPISDVRSIAAYQTRTYQMELPALPAKKFAWATLSDDDRAWLMRYCGQAVQMDYTAEESSARVLDMADALISVFNYSKTTKLADRQSYSDDEWEELIYHEVSVGRPVIYSGTISGTSAGHSFVVHGYRDGLFLVNWGWSGQFDGYFALTNLSPNGAQGFSDLQSAVVAIQPASVDDGSVEDVKEVRTIHLDKAGTLSEFISEKDKYNLRKLTLSGEVNSNDIYLIREMSQDPGRLEKLDLQDARIVKGGGHDDDFYGLDDDVIGGCMFLRCAKLCEIILPNSLTGINGEALSGTGITTLMIPKSVTNIAPGALGGCNNLASLTVEDGNPVYYSAPNSNAIFEHSSGTLIGGCATTVIPEGTTTIGAFALWSLSGLKTITLPESLTTIGDNAFYGCELSSIHIPKNVTSIGFNAFSAYGLTAITVDSENPVYDSRDNCNCLIETATNTVLTGCSNSKIPEGVVALGNESLSTSQITYTSLPQSLQSIGLRAFDFSRLREIEIPAGVTTIEASAFFGCPHLKVVKVNSPTPLDIPESVFANLSGEARLIVPDGTKEAYQAATGWNVFQHVMEASEYQPSCTLHVMPAGTLSTLIPEGDRPYIRELTLTGELNNDDFQFLREKMGDGMLRAIDMSDARVIDNGAYDVLCEAAFRLMGSLETVSLPKTLTTIKDYAFMSTDMRSLVVPKTVTTIGRDIFYYCENLSSLSVEEGNPTFDSRDNCNAIIETATNVLRIGCSSSVVPSGIVEIGDGAFSGVPHLLSVNLPDGVTKIGSNAFWSDLGLTSITLSKSVVELGVGPFVGCTNVKSFTIEPGNPVYDSRDNCNAIIETATNTLIQAFATTVIPESVVKIAPKAFQYQNISHIEIPASVGEIGYDAFLYCNNLTTVISHVKKPFPINPSVFSGDNMRTAVLYVPYGTKNAYANTSGWGLFPNIVEMEPTDDDYALHAASVVDDDFGTQYAGINGQVEVPVKLVGGSIEPITSIDYTITTGNDVFEGRLDVDPISYMMTSEVLIPFQADATVGERTKKLTITKVNGQDNETTENSVGGTLVTVKRKPKYVPLVEEATGTWCGWCTRGTVGLKMLNRTFRNDVVTIAVHTNDPMELPGYALGSTSFPNCQINHGAFCDPYYGTSDEAFGIKRDVEAAMRQYTIGEIAVNAEWADDSQTAIKVNTTTTFVEDVSASPYQIGYILLEDKMTGTEAGWIQSNYFANSANRDPNLKTLVDSPSKIEDMTYDYVPVAVWEPRTGVEGTLPATIVSEVPMNNTYTLDIADNTRIQNKERLTVVALLLNKETGDVLNVAKFKFTPDPDPSVVTVASYSRTYGDENPSFEFTVAGGALEGEPEIKCEATAASPVGEYPIVISQGSVTNEEVTYVGGTLTITKAPLTVTVADAEREQGQENPEFLLSYTGWKLNDNESVLTKMPVATTTATKDSPVGEYDIVVSGGEAQNYELSYVGGKLTVTVPSSIAVLPETNGTVDVYTLDGQLVCQHAKTLKGLSKGVYLIRSQGKNSRKLIIK